MEPTIVFDVGAKPFDWEPLTRDIIFLIFAFLVLFLKKIKWRYAVSEIWGYVLILCALITAGYDLTHWYVSRYEHRRALATGHFEVVEGIVQNLHPMPDDGSSDESFTISGHTFWYSDDWKAKTTTCFNHTTPHGGPIHAGMLLRVRFLDQCILQIEALPQNSATAHR